MIVEFEVEHLTFSKHRINAKGDVEYWHWLRDEWVLVEAYSGVNAAARAQSHVSSHFYKRYMEAKRKWDRGRKLQRYSES